MYEYYGTVQRVVDGDTLDVDLSLGFKIRLTVRVRLKNVDTPEKYGPNACEEGREVSKEVEKLCPVGQEVMVATHKTGKYGRWLADVTIVHGDNTFTNLNAYLMARGFYYEKP